MTRDPMQSSNIRSVGHDQHTNTMEVEFHSGRVVQYSDVNMDEHRALLGAKSIGSHFANIIRPNKTGRVIE